MAGPSAEAWSSLRSGNENPTVLGNHCVDTLTKDEFLGGVEQKQSYYSFDRGGFHFVVLDACFRGDGQPYGRKNSKWNDANIPAAELEWLAADVKATEKPVIVFAHQRLDVSSNHVFRHRTPLFIARVDPDRLCVLRETEQILMPETGFDLGGGFGVIEVSPSETWIVISEMGFPKNRQDELNRVRLAKVLWSQPNKLISR